MRIAGRERLAEAGKKHPGSGLDKALAAWVTIVENAAWKNFMDVKASCSGADNVPPKVVFNIKGKQFRLTAIVNYVVQTVVVERVQTHPEYTRRGP